MRARLAAAGAAALAAVGCGAHTQREGGGGGVAPSECLATFAADGSDDRARVLVSPFTGGETAPSDRDTLKRLHGILVDR